MNEAMFTKILVTLDGSSLSEAALQVALNLAEGTRTRVTLLRVAEPVEVREPAEIPAEARRQPRVPPSFNPPVPIARPVDEADLDEEYARREHELQTYLHEQGRPLRRAGIRTENIVRFGEAAEVIADHARTQGFDAVVMATHGRSGLARTIFGSVAAEVAEKSSVPVLLVRPRR
jgi:nucleotide-binding universal stress UspA family protein